MLTIEVIVPIVSTLLLLSNVLIAAYKPIEVIVIPIIKNAMYNLAYPVYNDFNNIFELPNVIIDFSTPEATIGILDFAISKNIALVIATTGFTEEQQARF